jgi:cytochrome c-type biogenesis protein CcsB
LCFYVLQATLNAVTWKTGSRKMGWCAMLLSFIALATALTLRSMHAQYFALSNMYESMLVLVMAIQLGFLAFDHKFKVIGFGWPMVLFILVAQWYNTTLPTEIHPLQAALQSYWRSIHVPIIISSYAMFTLAFVSSVVFLLKTRGQQLAPTMAYNFQVPLDASLNAQSDTFRINFATNSMQSAMIFDELSGRAIQWGIPLLVIGIILGGMWANEAWGNYWSWDPKESMSLVTALGYGIYLHLRIQGHHSPKVLAWISILGYGLMLLTYFGVNILGVGLHSYGKIG